MLDAVRISDFHIYCRLRMLGEESNLSRMRDATDRVRVVESILFDISHRFFDAQAPGIYHLP